MNEQTMIREVDIHEYLPVLIDIINTGKDVNLLISGSSMTPFLCHKRDTIIISKPDDHFYRGQMVFYIRDTGQYVMHRIHHIDRKGYLFIVGDAQIDIEGPIRKDQVFGVINKVIRKGKLIEKGNFWWDFFENVWIRIVPIRPYLVKLYSFIRRSNFTWGLVFIYQFLSISVNAIISFYSI